LLAGSALTPVNHNHNQTPQGQQNNVTPRTTGSLVAHSNDDVVTRMKNIEMIELGRHRIKPWYFSPYPNVSVHCCRIGLFY